METIEIQRKELNGAKPLCYGYKAVKLDTRIFKLVWNQRESRMVGVLLPSTAIC